MAVRTGRIIDCTSGDRVHLHLLGWDTWWAIGDENRGSDKTPGRAAVIITLILVVTYVLVAYAVQAFAGFGEEGIGLNNPENTDDVLTILAEPVAGSVAASLL